MQKKAHNDKPRWFAIRKEIGTQRGLLLKTASFTLPLAIWALVSYCPFIWHPDIKLLLSADREGVTTVFTAGDHVSREFFPSFAEAVRTENQRLLAARAAGEAPQGTGSGIRRSNLKILRHLAPVAIGNGWITRAEAEDDARLYAIWGDLAGGRLEARRPALSAENLAIIERNWVLLSGQPDPFSARALPEQPLEKLIPQGRPANPVYLPAPHEVILRGWEDFTSEPAEGNPSMWERYRHSLRIVFLGFFFSCLIGVPLGVLAGTFDFFSKLLEPFIDFFRYMPAPAFSTLLVAVFLAHDAPKIALVFVGTFFQMVLVVANTTRQVEVPLIEAAQTLGASRFGLIRRVILPGITPNLYNDLRILLGWSWTWLVIAELIGVKSGLTEFIETQGRWRNFDRVYPVIILIGVTGFLTDQILSAMRGYLFPWTPDSVGKRRGPVGRFFSWLMDREVYVAPMNGRSAS